MERGRTHRSAPALIASGLILFIITLVVNMIARAIIAKQGSSRWPTDGVTDKDDAEVLEGLSSQLAMKTLPRFAPCYSALIAAALAVIVSADPGAGRRRFMVILCLLYMVVQTGWSFAVEGRRFAVDRLATIGHDYVLIARSQPWSGSSPRW